MTEVVFLALVNYITTAIITENKIFEDVRHWCQRCGKQISQRWPRIGCKVEYFATCPMCVGTWIGFAEGIAFGGPIHYGYATWFVNGLLYKALAHLILQFSSILHNLSERLRNG